MNRRLLAPALSFVLIVTALAACKTGVSPGGAADGELAQRDPPKDADGDGVPDTEPPPAEPPAPTMMIAARDTVVWKRYRAIENDLMRALSLTKGELCREVDTFSCIDAAHLTTLGGNEPFEMAQYHAVAAPTVTTPFALERVVLAACSKRVDIDAAAPAAGEGEPVVFTAFDLAPGATVSAAELDALAVTLYRRLLARDPTAEEQAALQPLRDDGTSAVDVAKLACFAIGTSVELAFN